MLQSDRRTITVKKSSGQLVQLVMLLPSTYKEESKHKGPIGK